MREHELNHSNSYTSSTLENSYMTDYKAGQDNIQFLGFDVHNKVFGISAILIVSFILITLIFPEQSGEALNSTKSWVINKFDWLFMIAINIMILLSVAIIISPLGKIRLGGKSATPEYGTISWLCMLFASGVGIGLLFWGVAEPVAYYTNWYGTPLNVTERTPEAEALALSASLYHWGVHGWATYGLVGLALAFFSYNKGLPFTLRSTFYPIFGEKCWGPIGNLIDILAAIATVFGIATSLGLGAQQIASGLQYIFDTPNTLTTQILIIIMITCITYFSVIRGMQDGVKFLSNLNIALSILLLAVIFCLASTTSILEKTLSIFPSYVKNIIPLSDWYNREDESWYHGWTIFYWAWWVSWSPFVGIFMAKISKGRTVREFFLAVFIAPILFIGIWFSIMGGAALDQIINEQGTLVNGITNASLALYEMYGQLPYSTVIAVTSLVLTVIFFVTSADSGAIVVDTITCGGKSNSPIKQRVFWVSSSSMIAVCLLIGGGSQALSTIQAGVVATGLPFLIVLLLLSYSLVKGLKTEVSQY